MKGSLIDDLQELLYISKFLINKKKFKKDRKTIKKMIEKMENYETDSLIIDGDDDD